jgi:hypothetical protein
MHTGHRIELARQIERSGRDIHTPYATMSPGRHEFFRHDEDRLGGFVNVWLGLCEKLQSVQRDPRSRILHGERPASAGWFCDNGEYTIRLTPDARQQSVTSVGWRRIIRALHSGRSQSECTVLHTTVSLRRVKTTRLVPSRLPPDASRLNQIPDALMQARTPHQKVIDRWARGSLGTTTPASRNLAPISPREIKSRIEASPPSQPDRSKECRTSN